MKIIGLTGGIGSGKSTIAAMFKNIGIPVYIADIEAKKILERSKVVRRRVISLLGEQSYTLTIPNKKYIASKIFNDTELLEKMNAIIHPKIASHFKRWTKKQTATYCIKEAAVLFENRSYKNCDATILVTAPIDIRIARVIERDGVSKEEVKARMRHQWDDSKKALLADFTIENIFLQETQNQVLTIHNILTKAN